MGSWACTLLRIPTYLLGILGWVIPLLQRAGISVFVWSRVGMVQRLHPREDHSNRWPLDSWRNSCTALSGSAFSPAFLGALWVDAVRDCARKINGLILYKPLTYLYTSHISACQRRSANSWSVSGGEVNFSHLSCTLLRDLISFTRLGVHNGFAYSSMGLTIAWYSDVTLVWVSSKKHLLIIPILWLAFLAISWMWLAGFKESGISTPKSFCIWACSRLNPFSVFAYLWLFRIFMTTHLVSLNPRSHLQDQAASWLGSCWRRLQ